MLNCSTFLVQMLSSTMENNIRIIHLNIKLSGPLLSSHVTHLAFHPKPCTSLVSINPIWSMARLKVLEDRSPSEMTISITLLGTIFLTFALQLTHTDGNVPNLDPFPSSSVVPFSMNSMSWIFMISKVRQLRTILFSR